MTPHIKGPYVNRCSPFVFNKIINEMLVLIVQIQRINRDAEGFLEKPKNGMHGPVVLPNSNKLK